MGQWANIGIRYNYRRKLNVSVFLPMNPARTILLLMIAFFAAPSTVSVVLRAQTANSQSSPVQSPSVWDGIYTEQQAQRGEALYQRQCSLCHGAKLIGKASEDTPPLTGPVFMKTWNGRSLDALFKQILRKMPQDDPGTLTPKQTADLVAFILSFNKFPAGQTELPTQIDSLATIHLDARKPEAKNGGN